MKKRIVSFLLCAALVLGMCGSVSAQAPLSPGPDEAFAVGSDWLPLMDVVPQADGLSAYLAQAAQAASDAPRFFVLHIADDGNAAADALQQARAAETRLRQELDEALSLLTCQSCGYVFPVDSDFKFCPQCAAPC